MVSCLGNVKIRFSYLKYDPWDTSWLWKKFSLDNLFMKRMAWKFFHILIKMFLLFPSGKYFQMLFAVSQTPHKIFSVFKVRQNAIFYVLAYSLDFKSSKNFWWSFIIFDDLSLFFITEFLRDSDRVNIILGKLLIAQGC